MTTVLLFGAGWLVLSLLAAGFFGVICHGAELEDTSHRRDGLRPDGHNEPVASVR